MCAGFYLFSAFMFMKEIGLSIFCVILSLSGFIITAVSLFESLCKTGIISSLNGSNSVL